MKCIDCAAWRLREAGEMSRHGFGVCSLGERWKFLPPQATCPKYRPAPADVTAKRVAWLAKGKRK